MTAVLAVVVLGAIGLTPGAAHASQTCPAGYFCWYYTENQTGEFGLLYDYTSKWVPMYKLVDDSESSMDSFTGTRCPSTGHPVTFLSDTYMNQRWSATVGQSRGQRVNTFNPISTKGTNTPDVTLNENNRFNDVWPACF